MLPALALRGCDGSPAAAYAIGGITLGAYLLLQHLAFAAAMRRTYVPFVRRSLAALGHPTCVACGHRFGPAPPAACPECGTTHDGSR